MGEIQTITINGRDYDRSTGLPLGVSRLSRQELRSNSNVNDKISVVNKRSTVQRNTTNSSNIHSALSTSARIDSRFAKKPLAKRKLAYEKYGAIAEQALEKALARKAEASLSTPTIQSAQANISTPETTLQEVAQTTNLVSKAYVPAPAPSPSAPEPTHSKPTTPKIPVVSQRPAPIIKSNRQFARVDGFTSRPSKPLQARSLEQRKNLHPIVNETNIPSSASPDFNIPNSTSRKSLNTDSSREAPIPHPIHQRTKQIQRSNSNARAAQNSPAPTASVLKDAIVNEALEKAPKSNYRKMKQRPNKRRSRLLSFASGFVALSLFAGYVTYLNVPNISVRVAAAQAGIDASYPGYKPNGFKLNGPVAYSDGEIKMDFVSKQNGSKYTLRESRSSWSSSTLLENYVRGASNDDYTISKEKGITIYHYGSDAAWVSGGILYVIDGDDSLTPDEARRIATSV